MTRRVISGKPRLKIWGRRWCFYFGQVDACQVANVICTVTLGDSVQWIEEWLQCSEMTEGKDGKMINN